MIRRFWLWFYAPYIQCVAVTSCLLQSQWWVIDESESQLVYTPRLHTQIFGQKLNTPHSVSSTCHKAARTYVLLLSVKRWAAQCAGPVVNPEGISSGRARRGSARCNGDPNADLQRAVSESCRVTRTVGLSLKLPSNVPVQRSKATPWGVAILVWRMS